MSISYKLIHFIRLSLLVYMIMSVCTCHWGMTAFCIQHVFKNKTIEQRVSVTMQERYCIAVMDMVQSVWTKYNHVMQCVRQSNVSRLQNIVCHKQNIHQNYDWWYRIPQVVFAFSLTFVFKADMKSYIPLETAAIFFLANLFPKQGISSEYVTADFICMGLLGLQGAKTENYKI